MSWLSFWNRDYEQNLLRSPRIAKGGDITNGALDGNESG